MTNNQIILNESAVCDLTFNVEGEGVFKINHTKNTLIKSDAFLSLINSAKSKKSKNYLTLDPDALTSHENHLIEANKLSCDNTDFVTDFTRHFGWMAERYGMEYGTQTNYKLILIFYTEQNENHLFIGQYNTKTENHVNNNNELTTIEVIDTNKPVFSCMINLTQICENKSKHPIIVNYSKPTRRLKDFVNDTLGSKAVISTKRVSNALLQVIKDISTEDTESNHEDTIGIRTQAMKTCSDAIQKNKGVNIEDLSQDLGVDTKELENRLAESIGEENLNITPDKNTLNGLVQYKGFGGGLRVDFNAELLNERINYDHISDTLTIKGTPANLRDQLQRDKRFSAQ